FILALLILPFVSAPTLAINGGAPASSEIASQAVMIVSTRGASCTGTVIARDLLLTAAHCVAPKSNYAAVISVGSAPRIVPVLKVVLHPRYDPQQFETRKPSPDMAIVKISEPLPARYRVAKLSSKAAFPKHGEMFTLAGFGFARDGDERSAGALRSVTLPNIGSTGDSMIRVSAGNGGTAGACTGDSGGPAFLDGEVAGVIGWTSIPAGKNCGFTTGVTLVGFQRDWIEQTIWQLGVH
ncbi:MAG TPA: trypsin-like serine protease, partial [Bryobacteraceae bacterium]|nr:trypsin-like serine protease [Bryobacteraceae bacterium]